MVVCVGECLKENIYSNIYKYSKMGKNYISQTGLINEEVQNQPFSYNMGCLYHG